jgi:NTE family protein
MKKRALILSGGGFKGAFQLGALQYIKEHWTSICSEVPEFRFDIISGVSVGALNGLLIAQKRFDDLWQLWEDVSNNGVEEIYTSDFIDTTVNQEEDYPTVRFNISWDSFRKNFPESTKMILWRALFNRKKITESLTLEFQKFKSIADNAPLYRKLNELAKKQNITDTVFKCGLVSLDDGKYYSLKHTDFKTNDDFAKGILASTAIPIVWPPVGEIHSVAKAIKQSVDGGIREVSPLGDVIREIPDEHTDEYTMFIINCGTEQVAHEEYKEKNIAQIALRSLADIAINEIFNNDIKEFIDKNFIVQQILDKDPNAVVYDYDFANKKQGKRLKFFRAIIIQPDNGVLGDSLAANRKSNDRHIQHGRDKAAAAIRTYIENNRTCRLVV